MEGDEIAVGVGNVKQEAIETGIARPGISIGEMEVPKAGTHGFVAAEGDEEPRPKGEGHVDAASVGDRDIVRETEQAAIDVEEGPPTPVDTRSELKAEGAAATVGVLATVRGIYGM
jgi:hypothetical protein